MNERRRYRILSPVARGSFGTVYKAELIGQGGFTKLVALKVLNPGLTENVEFTQRLRDEARLLALIRHRAIVAVDGLVELAGRWTVVMEYIEGTDLKQLLQSGPVPPAAALEIVAEVAGALHVAWTRKGPDGRPLKVLHRDLKPSNIRITPAGEVKVLDFGVARAEFVGREAETRNLHFGSAAYMSPERIDFVDGPEGDVYALAAVLFEMLAGEGLGKTTPDPERHARRMSEALARLWGLTRGQGVAVVGPLLTSCLAYEASARPRARDLERRCAELSRKLPGLTLRDWAERLVGASLRTPAQKAQVQDDLSGNVIEETIDTTRSQPSSSTPVSNLAEPPAKGPEVLPSVAECRPEEDTDPGADSGWGARADLPLPVAEPGTLPPAPRPKTLHEQETNIRIAPPSGVYEPVGDREEVHLLDSDDLLTGEFEEPSDRVEAIEFLTAVFEKPDQGEHVSTDRLNIPRGRDAEPLNRKRAARPKDDGSGWVFGTLILAAIGLLVYFYMPEDIISPAGEPSIAEEEPLPGTPWNPRDETLRGRSSRDPARGKSSPQAAPGPGSPGAGGTGAGVVVPTGPETAPAATGGTGIVRVTGFASRVMLIGGGRRLPAGEVPAGSYRIEAVFADGEPIKAGRIQVAPDSLQTLHCSKVYKTCRVE